ncbi:MAG: SCO family protein [Candidatus Kapaibacterium sp.]|jgi:protein SCO1/2
MENNSKNLRRILWTVLAVFLLGIGLFSLYTWMKSQELTKPTQVLTDYGVVPDFSLIRQDKTPFTLSDLKGHIWVADFIFTHCAGTCPMMTSKMASLQKSMMKTGDVRLISFSVDPTRDTPEVLEKYAKNFGADTKTWFFLTGPVSSIFTLAKNGFHLPVDSVGGDQTSPIVHSERFVLVDAKGHIRGYYDGTSEEVQPKLLMDMGDLMREAKQ